MRPQISRNLFNGLPQDSSKCDGQSLSLIAQGRAGPPGYGPQDGCGPWGSPAERQAYVVEMAPHVGAPWRAKTWSRLQRAVVNPTATTGNAAAIASGALIAAAQTVNNANATALTPLNQTLVGDFVTVFQYVVPDYLRVLINKAAFSCPQSQQGQMALRWRVRSSGSVILEPEEISFADPDNQMDVFFNLAPKQVLTVEASNGDLLSPYLVEVLLSGWRYPIVRNEDSVPSAILGNGG
jgi:hypothetical protein